MKSFVYPTAGQFRQMWAEHERRWPERQSAAEPDGSADPAGTYRSRGGFKLDPERHAETIGAIGRIRETEPPISADMQAVERENTCGGWLAGFDRRIKSDDRLKEKVAEQAAAEPDKSSSAILRKIPDALRFTCCFEPDNCVGGYYDIKARLEDSGHEMYRPRALDFRSGKADSPLRDLAYALAGGAEPGPWWDESYQRILAAARALTWPSRLVDVETQACRIVGDEFYERLNSQMTGFHPPQWLRALAEETGAALSPVTPETTARLLAPCLETGPLSDLLEGSEPRELIREYYRLRRQATSPTTLTRRCACCRSGRSGASGGAGSPATSRPALAPPRSPRQWRSSTRRHTIRPLSGTRSRSAAKSDRAGHPEGGRFRVSAEAVCEIVHKAFPRKRHPDGNRMLRPAPLAASARRSHASRCGRADP